MAMSKCILAAGLATASAYQGAAMMQGAATVAPAARPALFAGRAATQLARMAEEVEEYPTLEEELEAGRITQEEYDSLTGGISEETYQQEISAEEETELSPEAERVLRGMRSSSGVEFAPWMKVDPEAIAKAKAERAARKARQAQDLRSDAMLVDPQAAELGAGGGLNSKIISEEEVELRWDTQDEVGNAGFIVQRRQGGSESFVDLATYEDFSPLRTKGPPAAPTRTWTTAPASAPGCTASWTATRRVSAAPCARSWWRSTARLRASRRSSLASLSRPSPSRSWRPAFSSTRSRRRRRVQRCSK